MQWDVALYDLVVPYVLRGAPLGPIHAAVSAIYVREFSETVADDAVAIRGVAYFSGEVGGFFDPSSGTIGVNAQNIEGHPRDDPGRRDPWIDLRDSTIAFTLTAPRQASTIVASGANNLNPGDHGDLLDLLDGLDPNPGVTSPSDYPSTAFTLDFVFTSAVLRPPFLKGARLLEDGRLVAVEGDDTVRLTLPRFKLRLTQGSDAGQPLTISMISFGANGLDDPGDLGVAELITMDPPYAFFGDSKQVGMGFRSAVLDLSTNSTPAAVLDQFGFDENWTGLYLPELSLFVMPNGLEDVAVAARAENLLIGWGDQPGVTGDFSLSVIDQGSGQLAVSARFVDAQGRTFGISLAGPGTATAAVPPLSTMIVDVQGGRPPYTISASIDGGVAAGGRTHEIALMGQTSRTIEITVSDTGSAPQATLTIQIGHYQPTVITHRGQVNAASITSQQTIRDDQNVLTPEVYIFSQNETSVTVGLRPVLGTTDWTPNPMQPGPDGEITPSTEGPRTTFDLGPDETQQVSVTVTQEGVQPPPMPCYFRYDRPQPGAPNFVNYVRNLDHSETTPAKSQDEGSGFLAGGGEVIATYRNVLDAAPQGTVLTIRGTASFEGNDGLTKSRYNYRLSRNRALAVRQLIEDEYGTKFSINIDPPDELADLPGQDPRPLPWWTQWKTHGTNRNTHWQATLEVPPTVLPETVTTATVTRPPSDPDQVTIIPEIPPADPEPPGWFRSIAAKVRIVHNTFIALEISGEVDFQTAAEDRLDQAASSGGGQSPGNLPLSDTANNPSDGIVDFKVLVQVDDAAQTWTVSGSLSSDPADIDGLVMTGSLPGGALQPRSAARNLLGMTTAMAPVLAAVAPSDPLNGDVGALVLQAGAVGIPFAMTQMGWLNVERVILYGGEIVVRDRTSGPEVSFLFDVETAISAAISLGGGQTDETPPADDNETQGFEILTIPRNEPLVLRYKAIGIRMGYTPPETRFQFRPVFDSSKGYTIEVGGPGGIQVAEPLGQILQVLAARLARQNPMTFEIDLGFSADLGVISIDRARVRLPIHELGPPELTALAASIDIPGVLRAAGYLEIGETTGEGGLPISEVRGGLDLTIVPVKLRIRAEIAVAQIPATETHGSATGVIVTIEVNFPAPIPLGSSGLGLLGVLGLFAMHYGRNETDAHRATPTPALAWLEATGGEPTRLGTNPVPFWSPQIDRWAFGVGAVLGTMEGGVLFNLKGVFLLELPGPRILLLMKAKLLSPPPEVAGVESAGGSLLAVIDLDAGRGTLTIGIVAEYAVEPIMKIRIPIEAFFDLQNRGKWHIFIGKFDDPIQAKIISVFEGSGYFMISGEGIETPLFPAISSGLAIATGLHVELIWGNKEIRIYASVAGGFDAVMGFKPFFLAGKLYIRGELRLIIIGISAYAELDVILGRNPVTGLDEGRLSGEICGEIDLFFFKIKGCVDFALGDQPSPPIPPLVEKVSLVSRGPALVEGTGADQPIDAVLAEAVMQDSAPGAGAFVEPSEAEDDDTRPRRVPIDSIIAIPMAGSPKIGPTTVLGENYTTTVPGSTNDGYIEQGGQRIRYDLTSVSLVSGTIGEGNQPVSWWADAPATEKSALVQLALLTWVPNATPAAIERSEHLNRIIYDRWGVVCNDPAPAAPVLWAFHDEPLGPSKSGWRLVGKAWPDPNDTERSDETDLEVGVCESWRSGREDADFWRGIYPSWIEGRLVPCKRPNVDQPEQPPQNEQVPGVVFMGTFSTPNTLEPADIELLRQRRTQRLFDLERAPEQRVPGLTPVTRTSFEGVRAASPLTRATSLRSANLSAFAAAETRARTDSPALTAVANRPLDARISASLPEISLREPPSIARARELEFAGALRRGDTAKVEELRLTRAMEAFTIGRGSDPLEITRVQPKVTLRSIELGQPVARGTFLGSFANISERNQTAAEPVGTSNRLCDSRVLSSPMLDHGEFVVMGDKSKTPEIEEVWNDIGYEQSPLANAVRVKSGGFVGGALLLASLRAFLEVGALVVRILDADGNEIDRILPTVADIVPTKPLPARWTDDDGPWCPDVIHAVRFFPDFADEDTNYPLILVDMPDMPEAGEIEIGIDLTPGGIGDRAPDGLTPRRGAGRDFSVAALTSINTGNQTVQALFRYFYVLCFELTRIGEVEREAYDEQLIIDDREAAGRALGLESGDTALLEPDTEYGLQIAWTQTAELADDTVHTEDVEETFWFHTTAHAPTRLGQYMLFSLPNEREAHVFGREPLKLVFSTQQVVNLFAAFGRRLQVRLRAASFRQPDPDDLPPGESYPFPLDGDTTEQVGPIVTTPYEAEMEDLLDGSCVTVEHSRVRHLSRDILVPLDPRTDYVLDIESLPMGDGQTEPPQIVHSVSFSTGAYATLDEFAVELSALRERHRWIEAGGMQTIANDFASRQPQGGELDLAMIDAGLEPLPVPDRPGQTVFWEQPNSNAAPEPVAILIDAPEPMARTWDFPKEVTDDRADPPSIYWKAQPVPWLDLEEGTETPGQIQRIVMAPGAQRALVILAPDSRGARVQVEMVRNALVDEHADPEGSVERRFSITDLMLDRAPWEE